MDKTVPITMCFDDAYAIPSAVTIKSILANSRSGSYFHFHILYAKNRLTEPSMKKLKLIADTKISKIAFIPLDEEIFENCPVTRDRYVIEAYFRYIIADYVEYDKCIYIDGDTLALEDLSELYEISLEGYHVGACLNASNNESATISKLVKSFKLKNYCNTGVLLVNLERWRAENIKQTLFENTNKYHAQISFVDQDVINITFTDSKKILDPIFNTQTHGKKSKKEFESELVKAKILHLTSQDSKPWHKKFRRFRFSSLWFNYAFRLRPYRKEVFKMYLKSTRRCLLRRHR